MTAPLDAVKPVIAIATANIEYYIANGRIKRPFEHDFIGLYPYGHQQSNSASGRIALAK